MKAVKNLVVWAIIVFVILLLIILYSNEGDFQAAVQQMTGWFS